MNLVQLNKIIEKTAIETPLVNSFYEGDVYDNWNTREIKYGSINIDYTASTRQENSNEISATIYYSDRLLEDKSNKLQIYTDAVNVIHSIISNLEQNDYIFNIQPFRTEFFEQKFTDEVAGGYVNLIFNVQDEMGECGYTI